MGSKSTVQPMDASSASGSSFLNAGAMVMLRNLPRALTRQMLLDVLDQQGFQGSYDFVYLPRDMRKLRCFGYAFINWVSVDHAIAVVQHFDCFCAWPVGARPCSATINSQTSLASVLERLQDSAVLRPETLEEFLPLVMSSGSLVPLTKLSLSDIMNSLGDA